MDEKTEELRDIFLAATGSDTVTERQEASRGSIVDREEATDENLAALVAELRERFAFRSGLETDALVRVLRGFFANESDADLAATLGVDEDEVFAARMDLQLVTDADHTPLVAEVRPLVVEGADLDACLEAVDDDVDPAAVRRAVAVVESERAAARTSYRFRDEFADRLGDEDLSARLATDARRDGLQDATEDLETDVSF